MDVATQTGNGQDSGAKLEDYAATAALYATHADRQSKNKSPLDSNNKLSSAGAAASLKYASPRDLPSFPSSGLPNHDSAAGAAASLANANQKSFEHWKPGYSSPANRAATLANDYKMAPLWHAEASAAGSQAAILAAKHGGNVNIWRPEASAEGNSAAEQAMRNKNLSPFIDFGYTKDGHSRALMAATGAMDGSRRRAGSASTLPSLYPDSANSAANALSAATAANRPSARAYAARQNATDLPGLSQEDANRIHNAAITNMPREMYTFYPPVAPEVEEKKRSAGLHAAAVSMAKQMYDITKARNVKDASATQSDSLYAANSVHGRQSSLLTTTEEQYTSPNQYAHLQEAAQKLAAERLAKLNFDENAAYRNYYGASPPQTNRLSIRGRMRRRASSDGQLPASDMERSQQIRSQMNLFNDKVVQVDQKKRQRDREALLAAAQRNVAKKMSGMDEKVFADTGKVSPAMMAEWEAKARARAEAESSTRMANHGKVAIGGGKFMDQSEIDTIAAARVQPTLDEISATAEAARSRDEQRRQEAEDRRRAAEETIIDEKQRNTKTKEEWKRFKEEEKRDAKAKKEQEKAHKAEGKRLLAEQKRNQEDQKRFEEEQLGKEKHISKAATLIATGTAKEQARSAQPPLVMEQHASPTSNLKEVAERAMAAPVDSAEPSVATPHVDEKGLTRSVAPTSATVYSSTTEAASTESKETTATSATTRGVAHHTPADQPSSSADQGKVSTWLKSKFVRRSKTIKPEEAAKVTSSTTKIAATATLSANGAPQAENNGNSPTDGSNGLSTSNAHNTSASHEHTHLAISQTIDGTTSLHPSSSHHDVAMASVSQDPYSRSTSISSISSDAPTRESTTRGRSTALKPAHSASEMHNLDPGTSYLVGESKNARDESGNSRRGSQGEMFEEARDTFDGENLPVPSFPKERGRASPVRDSRFVEEL